MAKVPLQDRIAQLVSGALGFDIPSVDTDLFDTGALDSLAFVELLALIEGEFGVKVTVEDMELDHFRSIARIAAFVKARLPKNWSMVEAPVAKVRS